MDERLQALTETGWDDLRLAYNFGLIEPEPGSIEAAAFGRMAAADRREADRVAAKNEAEAS